MTEREALKLSLEALKTIDEAMPFPVAKLAQAAIKEALAQPEQEPVEVFLTDEHQMGFKVGVQSFILDYWPDEQAELEFMKAQLLTAFARAKAQRKPLSEEEIGAILEDVNAYGTRLYTFARAIEAAHGIKGEA